MVLYGSYVLQSCVVPLTSIAGIISGHDHSIHMRCEKLGSASAVPLLHCKSHLEQL